MRDEKEIDNAMVKLITFLKLDQAGALPRSMPDEVKMAANASRDVLCWVLGHAHPTTIEKILTELDTLFTLMKVEIVKGDAAGMHSGEGGQA